MLGLGDFSRGEKSLQSVCFQVQFRHPILVTHCRSGQVLVDKDEVVCSGESNSWTGVLSFVLMSQQSAVSFNCPHQVAPKRGEGGKGKGTQALEVSFAHRSQVPPTEHRPRPQVTDSTHRSQALPFSEAFTNPGVFVCLFVFHLNFILFIFNWRIIPLQDCTGFYQTPTWISHSLPMSLPTWTSLPPLSPSHPSRLLLRPFWVPWVTQ